ncbi:hypothetical protein COCNU_07G000480 [Cocos nucifera]|uniref:EGF-like domain-containing protein n=1 Tax=Cocos nucifera TaxID=13894 RepID=A0A8K0IDM1_COCNU|nr:hypothetical protein COCNU_07G000480 [Cocos nucifera]
MGAWMLLCHSLLALLIAVTASALADTLPRCPPKCGDVDIPYPFGIGPNCSFPARGFALTCNDTGNGVRKPFLTNVEFINVSLLPAQARIYNQISWQCYNATYADVSYSTWYLQFIGEPYRFSDTDNKFTVVGCDNLAYISGQNQKEISYTSGCLSICYSSEGLTNGSCSGIGCCQTSIPKGINYYNVTFDGNFNNSRVWKFNPCSFAVLAEVDWFSFSTAYITTRELNETNGGRAPVVLDWAIGNETCEVAQRNTTSYACLSKNSKCFNSSNGSGYLCNCSSGYKGNPYLADGCQDIDECTLKDEYPCNGICTNIPGDYLCKCPPGTKGDPKYGTCNPDHGNLSTSVKLVIGNPSLTCQLTAKSDVYSFGVVLLELLTGRKAIYFEGSDEEKSLSSSFLSAMKEDRLLQLLDTHIKNEEDVELIGEAAELARQCLNVRGEDRPTMKEVADDLDRLRKFKQHPFLQHNSEEIESLLGQPSSYTENEISGYYSIETKAALDIECGR